MKFKTFILLLVIAAVAGAGGWFAAKRSGGEKPADSGARRILYYQSPMHPWITSDKPGRCTICGMQLEPVYEGERGFATDERTVTLGSNSVQVINVQTEVVAKRPLSRTLRVAGVVEDNDTKHRKLSAYSEGRVEKLFVNYVGAEVVAGQPLAVFYSPALLAAESEYLTVLRQNRTLEISDSLRQEHARLVEAAAQRLKRLGYSDAQLAALASKDSADARTEILAPMTGTVVSRNVYEGQYVKEGDVLFEIGDFETMWFQFDAYERDLGWLRVGQQVEVTTPSLPGKVFAASISFIDPNLNELTRSAKVRVELPNPIVPRPRDGGPPRRLLYHKLYADAVVKSQTPDVLAVPRSAVLSAAEPIVYVEAGPGAYQQRKVKLGRLGDEYVEVIEGVAAPERVVTTGNLLIDAQAQLNMATRAILSATGSNDTRGAAVPVAPVTETNQLTPTQQETAREFLKLTSDLGAALASDDLKKFNDIAPRLHAFVPRIVDAFGGLTSLRPSLQKLQSAGHLERAADLAAARQQFLPFSVVVVDLSKLLRAAEPFKSVRIFNCPMVDRAVRGAAKNGPWIQLDGPLRNPFFGAEMIDCGSEVKP